MDFSSGSGNFTTMEGVNFSCITSELDPDGITDREFWSLRDGVQDGGIPSAVLQMIIFLVATGWNLFIIIVYITKRDLLKEPANLLLFTLAITHLMVCIIIMPVSISVSLATEFVLGHNDRTRCTVCSIQGFFFMFLTFLSIHCLGLLSIDRCILLSNPLKYPRYRKVKIWIVVIVLVWTVCFVFSIPPAFGFGEWEFNRNFGICMPRWLPLANFIYMATALGEGLIPIIIIFVTNIWTYKIIQMFLKRKSKRQNTYHNGSSKDDHQKREDKTQYQQHQSQLVRVFGALLLSTLLAWTPIMTMSVVVIITRGEGIPTWTYLVGWFFYLINPLVHPILESLFIKELRTKINRAQTTIRRASVGLIKLTTRSTLKDIPVMMPEDSTKSTQMFSFTNNTHTTNPLSSGGQGISPSENSPDFFNDSTATANGSTVYLHRNSSVTSPNQVRFSLS